ncbi:hypothetical protein [Herbaspirillum rubrisubalbicans]|uniref:hypothetical protein n=1 Tax=Herbaspirillum rubrisubalbicans TaxID=80842 RepID=UPI0011BE90F5|nr:hypothetical protein [Herbaspirillum rubrisubalbicans]
MAPPWRERILHATTFHVARFQVFHDHHVLLALRINVFDVDRQSPRAVFNLVHESSPVSCALFCIFWWNKI